MMRFTKLAVAGFSAAALAACGHANAEKADPEQAAQVAADSARSEGAPPAEVSRRAETARRSARTERARERRLDTSTTAVTPAAPAVLRRTVNEGTRLELAAVTDISSQKNKAGDPFTARVVSAALSEAGDTLIPVGAELIGRVSTLKSAPNNHSDGQLALEFTTVRFGGQDYPIAVSVASMATHNVSRGLTVDDAAKVGVGAAAGALAGRLLGHRTGTAAGGAVVGGAAGAVYANQTRDHDIALSPGSSITVVLSSPFTRDIAAR
ncbi:MAG TPA: hypothetical protein VGI92_09780 [Gemmatimonadales bacterium]|jgi:hypothetical protein